MRRAALWIGGIVTAAAAVVIGTTLQSVPGEVVDVPAAKDKIRPGDDIRASASIVATDGSGTRVVKGDFDLDPKIKKLLAAPHGALDRSIPADAFGPGIDFTEMQIKIVLEGRRAEQIRIIDISPELRKRDQPVQGTFFDIPGQGINNDAKGQFDLDSIKPVLKTVPEDPSVEPEPYFAGHTISLVDKEQVALLIKASSLQFHALFTLKITYLIGGETKEQIIDNHGKAFELAGARCGALPQTLGYKHIYKLAGEFSIVADPHPDAYPAELSAKYCKGSAPPSSTSEATVSAAPPTIGIEFAPNQEGFGRVRPSKLYGGGSPAGMVDHLKWITYGGNTAEAEGEALYVPKNGAVAEGRLERVHVIASDVRTCKGTLGYQTVEWTYPNHPKATLGSFVDICSMAKGYSPRG